MVIKEVKEILKMSKEQLLEFTKKILEENGYKDIISTNNYTYAKGEIPILLVAHCDTVHKVKPDIILFDKNEEMMWSPQGIGGDDRCGVIAIFDIIKNQKPHVLFTQDEEIGGLGAKAFCDEQELNGIKFAIEIDRRGFNQAVFYDCANKELQSYICDKYEFELGIGSFTDVCYIGERFDIGIVNLSAGYYNEHQLIEFIYFPALRNTIEKVRKILEENIDKYFDYQEELRYCKNVYNTYFKNFDDYSEYYSKYTYQEEKDFDELTKKQWYDLYGYKKPKNKQELYRIIFDY